MPGLTVPMPTNNWYAEAEMGEQLERMAEAVLVQMQIQWGCHLHALLPLEVTENREHEGVIQIWIC